jgi:predicted  nucleic acid-binding Zn-ribbon protein
MPHQCLGCDEIYSNTSDAILKGCPKCGRRAFLYIKKIPEKEVDFELTKESKEMILQELKEVVDIEESEKPIILKLENIRILSPGKYEIDINQLMKKEKPIIYKVQEGTYVIDLASLKL